MVPDRQGVEEADKQGQELPPAPFSLPSVSLVQLQEKLDSLGFSGNDLIERSLAQAQESHGEQIRDDGSPYLEQHIYPVTLSAIEHELAVGHRVSAKLVATCLNHDVPEDDPEVSLNVFDERFGRSTTHVLTPGRTVADFVRPLTKGDPDDYPGDTPAERLEARDEEYHAGLAAAQYESVIGKLADREQNIFSLHLCDPEKIVRKILETEEHYLPMAQRVSAIYFESISTRIQELKVWLRSGGIEIE